MLAPELQSEIREAMAGLRGIHARLIAQDLSKSYGVSLRQIYALSRDLRPARRMRKDAGLRRKAPPRDKLEELYAVVQAGLPPAIALQVMTGNGRLPEDKTPCASTLRTWLREDHVGEPTDNRVARQVITDYPNQMHQTDSTVSAAFYLDGDGSVGYESRKHVYKNKKGNQRPRLILYTLVDDYSRATYARYYLEETATTWIDFLWHAWAQKDDPATFPFEGIPEVLYSDNGSPLKADRVRRGMKALGVDQKFHRPFHPQSKGKVERRIGVLQGHFESLLLLRKPKDLHELNHALNRHVALANMEIHSVTKAAPFQKWLDPSRGLIRRVPGEDLLRAMKCVRETRVLDVKLCFSVNGEQFQAPYEEPFKSMPRGQKVEIMYAPESPFEMNIIVGRASFTAIHAPKNQPLPLALPAADEAKTRINELNARIAGIGLEHLDPFAHEAQAKQTAYFMPQQGEAVDAPAAPERQRTWVDTMRDLQDAAVCARPATDADTVLVDSLMSGAKWIAESKVKEFIRQHQQQQQKRAAGVA